MSPQRNTPHSMLRRRHTVAAAAAVLTPIIAGLAACSTDQPTAPQHASADAIRPAGAAHFATAPAPKPKPSPQDSANRMTAAQLAADTTWHTVPSDIEAGTDLPLPLVCGFSGISAVSGPIGPKGGRLTFGKSALVVPKGALTATTQITATITLGSSVQVTFAPHGLHFNKPVQIIANYAGCIVPAGGAVNVYYTNDSGGIVQSMPSANNSTGKTVTALTDHFSGYTVSYGRR